MLSASVMKLTMVLSALICLAGSDVTQAALIVGYSGENPPASTTAAGTTNAGITLGPGVTAAGGGNFPSKDWTTGATPDANDYVQFGWTASPAYGFDLTALEIQYRRTGSGPTKLDIQVQINNGSFVTIFTDSSVSTSNDFQNIDLTAYNNVTSAIFRVLGYQATNGSGQLDFTNFTTPAAFAIRVTGVAATPEPASLAIFGLGAVAAGYAGWRRRKATLAQKV